MSGSLKAIKSWRGVEGKVISGDVFSAYSFSREEDLIRSGRAVRIIASDRTERVTEENPKAPPARKILTRKTTPGKTEPKKSDGSDVVGLAGEVCGGAPVRGKKPRKSRGKEK